MALTILPYTMEMLESGTKASVFDVYEDKIVTHTKQFARHVMAEAPGYRRGWDAYVFEGIQEREQVGYPEERLWDIIHNRAVRLSDIVMRQGPTAALDHAEIQLKRMRSTTRRISAQKKH